MMAASLRTFEGGPPLRQEDLRSFEEHHGITLPSSYREFLLATNGGRPERDLVTIVGLEGNPLARIHLFFGLRDSVESCNLDWNLDVFRDRIPAGLLPIATTEGTDKICLSVREEQAGSVFYWDGHAQAGQRSLYFLADDFALLLSSLQADELSPGTRNP
jgi:hypothetical protein